MKIRVTLKVKANSDLEACLDIVVRPSETVASVKEKVAAAQLIPYPEQELFFEGTVLGDELKLSTSGICEGSSVILEVKATEASLVQQLKELLQTRDLSSDELALLYCYKHGSNLSQAFKFIGFDGKLSDFIAKQKSLAFQNGCVSLTPTQTALKPFSALDEVVQLLKENKSSLEIKELCNKFVQKFGVHLSSIVGSRPVEFFHKEKSTFVLGRGTVSLHGVRKKKDAVLSLAPHGLGPDAPPGLGEDAPPGLDGSSVDAEDQEYLSIDNQQFLDLHEKIHSRSYNSKITQSVNDLVSALSDMTFLDIDHIVIGGSVGKGTAIAGEATANVTFFLRGLPANNHAIWLAPLLKAIAGVIAQDFQTAHGIENVQIVEDCIRMQVLGLNPVVLQLHLSPTFANYQETLQAIRERGHDEQKRFASSLVKERTQFVSRQPNSVKITIRLMKWWRDQQEWYGRLSRPSDEILELAAVYSAVQTKPADQKEAIANLMSLLSRFEQVRVVWSNYYHKDDVCSPLLRQRPLLMDPTNPFVNEADPQIFDASELMVLARSTHFFW